jgi:predicted RND superfamily exporter protein
VLAVLLAIPATWRTTHLYMHLKGDFEELLPKEAPSVIALDTLRHRTPGLQFLSVVVDAGDSAKVPQAERFIDDLAAKVRGYSPELVRAVRTDNAEEQRFIEKHAPLYIETKDLQTILDRLQERKRWEEMRATFGRIDDEEEPPDVDFTDIRAKYDTQLPVDRESTRYTSITKHLVVMLIQVGGEFSTGNATGMRLYKQVRQDIAALGGTDAYAKGMRVGFTGDVATYVEETEALAADLALSSVLVIIAVIAVLIWFYRWWRSVLVLVPPLLLATSFSFAIVSLPPFNVTALNSNTAFLGSIIVGNGINFGIVLLARYVEERRKQNDVNASLVTAIATSRAGTLAAALAAGVSYATLGITQFRGFRQFGTIGGIGMVFAWMFAYTLMPPLIRWLDHSPRTAPKPRRATSIGVMGRVANFVSTRPRTIAIAGAVLTALAIIPVSHFGSGQLESDLSKLRRRDTMVTGAGYWAKQQNLVLGRYLTPMIILTDSEDDAAAIDVKLSSLLEQAPFKDAIATVRTGRDLVPSDQHERIALANKIRSVISPGIRKKLTPDQNRVVDEFLGNEKLEPVSLSDVPESFKVALRERDGSLGKTVLIYPKLGWASWDGPTLIALVDSIREVMAQALPKGHTAELAGSLPVSADILEFMRKDGLITSAMALLGVIAVVFLLTRGHKISWYVVASVLMGVLYLLAITVIFKIKINFANFIAFPITFGIGVDYAVNVATRYLSDGESDVRGAVASTGGAVGLCSLTTIIGYSSLLLAENNALFLFGLLAVLGEVTCLTVAVTILPSLLLTVHGRRDRALAHGERQR